MRDSPATDGWPQLELERLDDSPLVTVTFERIDDRTALTVHVEVPSGLPDDGLPGWWSMARDGWRDTVDRLAVELASAAA